jgi:hypothetical protein
MLILLNTLTTNGGEKMPAILIKDFPKDLHHKAKIQAALEEISLKDLITKSVTEYLKRAGVPEMQADQRKEG